VIRPLPILLLTTALAAPALAQNETYCHVTSVRVRQLSNAVKITLRADGVLRPRGDWRLYWEEYAKDQWRRLPVRRFLFRLTNARTKVGNYIDVGKYPVSHLEMTVPSEATRGIGLDVAVVLYRPGEIRRVRIPGLRTGAQRRPDKVQVDLQLSRDQRSVDIWVTSDRSPLAVGREQAVKEIPAGRLEVVARDGGVKVTGVNVTLRELLEMIGRVTDTPIVVGGDVQRFGSAVLPFLPLERLLRLIADAWGVAVVRRGGGYVVRDTLTARTSGYELGRTHSLPVLNSTATEAAAMLPNFLDKYVYVDDTNSRLVVTAAPHLAAKIERDLRRVDRPPPQIQVEVLVLEGRTDDDWQSELGLSFVNGETQGLLDSRTGDIQLHVLPGLDPEFELQLRALETAGRVRTRAAPQVTVVNHEPAEVFVGQRKYFAAKRGWRRQEVFLSYVDVGVRLQVTPWTGDGREITVPFRTEAGNIIGVDQSGLPLLAARRTRGTVRVANGETILIAGLRLASDEVTHRRAPGLAELPLIGSLFGSRRRTQQDTDLAIFLTPRAHVTIGSAAWEEPPHPQGG